MQLKLPQNDIQIRSFHTSWVAELWAALKPLHMHCENATDATVLLKLDLKNAFNSIRRDVVAEKLQEHMPN